MYINVHSPGLLRIFLLALPETPVIARNGSMHFFVKHDEECCRNLAIGLAPVLDLNVIRLTYHKIKILSILGCLADHFGVPAFASLCVYTFIEICKRRFLRRV